MNKGMFLTFIYMKKEKTKTDDMVLKSKLSFKGTEQRAGEEMKAYMMILRHPRLVRLPKEAWVLEIQAKNVALRKKVKDDPAATKAAKGREALYYRVTCKDNGRGMPHDDIPNMFVRGVQDRC
uniref:Uncharacterized protein n=1 Tax=Solanum lycopersicum TaxID=4081 RepID=A0A3Q7IVM1_SOLLC